MTLLAGDIGGTKTELALFSPERGPRKPLARAEFPSGNYPSLEAIVREFLDGAGKPAGQFMRPTTWSSRFRCGVDE